MCTSQFEINDIDSALAYLSEADKEIYNDTVSEISKINSTADNEISKSISITKLLYHAIIKAFKTSEKSVSIIKIRHKDKKPILAKYFSNEKIITISGKFNVIGHRCFDFALKAETLIFEEGVEYIDEAAAFKNSSLKSLKFPASLTHICNLAFADCENLEAVEFGNNSVHFHSNAFRGTKWFNRLQGDYIVINNCLLDYRGIDESIIIPNNVEIIGDSAFSNNSFIKHITVSDSVVCICSNAFVDCQNLEDVTINGDSLKIIEPNAFGDCDAMKSITLNPSLEIIGFDAFPKTTNIVYLGNSPIIIQHIKEHYPNYEIIDC